MKETTAASCHTGQFYFINEMLRLKGAGSLTPTWGQKPEFCLSITRTSTAALSNAWCYPQGPVVLSMFYDTQKKINKHCEMKFPFWLLGSQPSCLPLFCLIFPQMIWPQNDQCLLIHAKHHFGKYCYRLMICLFVWLSTVFFVLLVLCMFARHNDYIHYSKLVHMCTAS